MLITHSAVRSSGSHDTFPQALRAAQHSDTASHRTWLTCRCLMEKSQMGIQTPAAMSSQPQPALAPTSRLSRTTRRELLEMGHLAWSFRQPVWRQVTRCVSILQAHKESAEHVKLAFASQDASSQRMIAARAIVSKAATVREGKGGGRGVW